MASEMADSGTPSSTLTFPLTSSPTTTLLLPTHTEYNVVLNADGDEIVQHQIQGAGGVAGDGGAGGNDNDNDEGRGGGGGTTFYYNEVGTSRRDRRSSRRVNHRHDNESDMPHVKDDKLDNLKSESDDTIVSHDDDNNDNDDGDDSDEMYADDGDGDSDDDDDDYDPTMDTLSRHLHRKSHGYRRGNTIMGHSKQQHHDSISSIIAAAHSLLPPGPAVVGYGGGGGGGGGMRRKSEQGGRKGGMGAGNGDGRKSSSSVGGDRRYECMHPQCTRTFTRLFNLKAHQETHNPARTRAFQCNECGVSFCRAQDLLRHGTVHDKSNLMTCPACGPTKTFSRKDALRRHVRINGCCSLDSI